MTRPARSGARSCPLITVAAHTAMAVGQCLVIGPTRVGLVVATGTGLFTSCVMLRTRDSRPLGVFVPLIMATIVAVMSFEAMRHHLAGPDSGPLAESLMTFPPGTALTTATVELASDELVADAGTIALVTVQLSLFAVGICMDAELARLHTLPDSSAGIGSGTTWLGAAVFVAASFAYFRWPAWSHRRSSAAGDSAGSTAA